MFESFVTSLLLLFLLSVSALIGEHFPFLKQASSNNTVNFISGMLGITVIGRLIYKIFIGALKYDINDAMLAGQTEVAERFFKRSLSFLHSSADILRTGKSLEVANYHIGNSFYEIFSYIKINLAGAKLKNGALDKLLEHADYIKRNPSQGQEKIDEYSLSLIVSFLNYCNQSSDRDSQKSFQNISLEMEALQKNNKESQELTDTRLASILEEIANLIENKGESLFHK